MAAAATAASTAPFVVGRPAPDPPLPYPVGDLRHPGLARRAKTALGVGMTVNHVVSSSTPATVAAVTRNRDAVTSRGGPWPRLVVRDASGRTLDTFTTLQDAIYRASWTVKALHEWPVTPLQWRLPKAPVPSRPDFSRAAPRAGVTSYSLDLTRSYRDQLHSAHVSAHPVLEIDVDDVAFVAESLRLLPELPSFAFLRHSLLAGERTYLNIVGSLLLHQRHLAWTDKRQADYTFPGFCTGCRRAGFCYGCDKNPKPHVHEDIPMRMGGGFQYYRRDRPLNQHLHRDPRNWATGDADIDLRNIVERCGGLALYERAAMASQGVMEAGGVTSQLPFLPSFSRVRLLAGPWPGQKNFFIALRDPDKENEEEEEEDDEKDDTVDFKRRPDTIATERPWRKSALKKDSSLSGTSGVDSDDRKRSQSLRRSVTIDTGMARVHGEEASEEEEEEEEEGERAGEKKEEEEEDTGRDTEYDSGFEGGGTASHRHRPARRMGTSSRPSTFSPTRSVTFTRSRSRSGARSRSRSKSPGGVAFGGSLSRSRSSAQSAVSRDTSESAESRKARLENIPFAKKRGDVLYKAPSVFRPVKRGRRITVARDPFSRDRQYNIPQGGAFQLKKGGAKTTKFVNIKRGDAGWKPPKMFELKHNERQATQFWSRSNKDKGKGRRGRGGDEDDDDEARRRRRRMADSEDSGLDSDLRSASTRGKDTGLAEKNENENETDDDAAKETGTDVTGDGSDQAETAEKKKRKEVVKKARRVISPPGAKLRQRSPTPPPPPREPTPEPTPPPTPPPPTPPYEEPPLPDITLPEIPDLPEWKEAQKAEKQKKQKFLVAPPPVVKEAPKRRKPPPRVRRPLKVPLQRLKTKPAEAPVSSDQVHDMQDPLDWLAKYCIINPDRLPLYEMVFEYVVAEQKPRYTKPRAPSLKDVLKDAKADNEAEEKGEEGKEGKEKKKKKGKKKREKPEKEEKTLNEFALLQRSLVEPKVGLSLPEQQLEKLCYTLDTLHHKLEELGFELQTLEDNRTKQVASKARELFPEVAAPDYAPKVKKKGKKSKSKPTTPAVKLRAEDITDDIIMSRLDDKMLSVLRHEPDVRQTELEMERAREKIRDVTERLQELATEKLLTDAFCMNHYFARQGVNNKPRDFRRQQSELYNRLHPDPDFEMNFEEVEEALQQINGHLLTEKEFFFLYNVLNLPARTSLNFRLFSVVAALSEKVTQLDPVIRKLINNTDLNALDIKMEKCRELFMFLEDGDSAPRGGATADKLAVELTAGGLTPEHTRFVLTKFNREMRGVVDFLDFVTYVPLFILIHRRIISHPLREELDL